MCMIMLLLAVMIWPVTESTAEVGGGAVSMADSRRVG